MQDPVKALNDLLASRKICRRCVLPESRPDILIDEEGICSVCREHEKTKEEGVEAVPLETEFTKMLKTYKSYGPYDCLVMCSGGKDSTAALYYMKKRYKLNPLAFTFDHGFETGEALRNINNAVARLGVDFLYFKTDYMTPVFSRMLKTGSQAVICHICSLWYMDLTLSIAARYAIPVIIAGWTKGQSKRQPLMSRCGCSIHQAEFVSMAKAAQEFLGALAKDDPRYNHFPRSMEEVLVRAKKRQRFVVLSPHWFLPYDSAVYAETIKEELGWEMPRESYPARTTNCSLNFISVYNSLKYFGYTHYHVEMSKLIREGLLTREEALESLRINFDTELLNRTAQKLDFCF